MLLSGLFSVFTSCEELKEAGYVTDGHYNIYPNGDGKAELVFCNMSAQGNKIIG